MKKTKKQRAATMALLTQQMVANSHGMTLIVAYGDKDAPINAGHIQSNPGDNFVLISNLMNMMGANEQEQKQLRDLFTEVLKRKMPDVIVTDKQIEDAMAEATPQDAEALAEDMEGRAKAMRKAEDDELNERSDELERQHEHL